jgi:AraC-like DNA-binding protein
MRADNDVFTIKDEEFGIKVDLYGHTARTSSHRHDFIEFTIVEQGFTMHRAEGEKASLLLPGDLLFILPGTAHEYWKSTNNKVYNCLFYSSILGEDIKSLIELPLLKQIFVTEQPVKWGKIHLKPNSRFIIMEILKKIQAECAMRDSGWKIRSKALLIDFLVNISRVWGKTGPEKDFPQTSKESLPYTPYSMIEILENSQNNRKSIESMASEMGYSAEHFSRLFKKLTGISPSAYLTSMRIAAAAEKLMDERLSITDVAEITGFEDVNYFSRVFKKETGKTPTEFRDHRW